MEVKYPEYCWECLLCNRDYSEEPYAEAEVKSKKGESYSGFVCKECFLKGLHSYGQRN